MFILNFEQMHLFFVFFKKKLWTIFVYYFPHFRRKPGSCGKRKQLFHSKASYHLLVICSYILAQLWAGLYRRQAVAYAASLPSLCYKCHLWEGKVKLKLGISIMIGVARTRLNTMSNSLRDSNSWF